MPCSLWDRTGVPKRQSLIRNLAGCVPLQQKVYKSRGILYRDIRASSQAMLGIGVNVECDRWLHWVGFKHVALFCLGQTCSSEAPLKSI